MSGKVLVLLLAVISSVFIVGQAAKYSPPECDNESALKISELFALHHRRTSKLGRLSELWASLNSTLRELEETDAGIENLTTPELTELDLSQMCNTHIPRDCCQIKQMFPSAKSGLYAIRDPCLVGDKLFSSSRLIVYCDMETDGGGWIVIQRRNASMGWVNFARGWADYEKGFGDLDGEFWIGLKNIYELSNQQRVALRLSVWNDTENSTINWVYPFFNISGATDKYALTPSIGRGSGDGDYRLFTYEGNFHYYFTTYDYYHTTTNCGYKRQSGWWYYSGINGPCSADANLNGLHQPSGLRSTDKVRERLVWRTNRGYTVFTHSEMKIRPQSCQL